MVQAEAQQRITQQVIRFDGFVTRLTNANVPLCNLDSASSTLANN
jgi:hypothetical protein